MRWILYFLTFLTIPCFILGVNRCYGDLGCFDSNIYHALPQDPDHVRTQFHLFCRNSTDDVVVEATSGPDTTRQIIDNSCFAADRPTKILIHGFNDMAAAHWVQELRNLLLDKGDYNIFAVDWQHGAKFPYVQAVANTFLVAKQTAIFLRRLETVQGLSPVAIHVIGHSLGAQIAGNVGHDVAPTRLGRITGLDPAEPYFGELDISQRLDASDAIFVDVIHTDGEKFTGTKGYGSTRVQGHVDIFPNGGEKQPGCVPSNLPGTQLPTQSLLGQLVCSHTRAYELFSQSLRNASCHMTARACASWDQFEKGECQDCSRSGSCLNVGMDLDTVSSGARGSFFLSTMNSPPYCGYDYQISIELTQDQQNAYGKLYFVLEVEDTSQTKSNVVDFTREATHYHGGHTDYHVVTTSLTGPHELASVHAVFEKGSGLSAIGTSSFVIVQSINVTETAGGRMWQSYWNPVYIPDQWTKIPLSPST